MPSLRYVVFLSFHYRSALTPLFVRPLVVSPSSHAYHVRVPPQFSLDPPDLFQHSWRLPTGPRTRVADPQRPSPRPRHLPPIPVLSIPILSLPRRLSSAPLARLGLPPSPDPHRLAGVLLLAPSTPVSPVLARPPPLARPSRHPSCFLSRRLADLSPAPWSPARSSHPNITRALHSLVSATPSFRSPSFRQRRPPQPRSLVSVPPSPHPRRLAGLIFPSRPLSSAPLARPRNPVVSPASSSTSSSRFPSSLDAIVSRPVSASLLLLIPVVSPPPSSTPSSLEPNARSSRRRPPDPRLLVGLPLLSRVIPLPDGWIPSPRWRHPLPVVSPASSPSLSSRSRASCSSESDEGAGTTRNLETSMVEARPCSSRRRRRV